MQQSANVSDLTSKINLPELQARFETVRQSQYFPAILGAVAGGLTGAVMAGLIAGRSRGDDHPVREEAVESSPRQTVLLGFTLSELMQLVTVVASLARQLREWRDQSQY